MKSKENMKFFQENMSNEVSVINTSTLRQLWSVIEQTQSSLLLKLSNTDLVKRLLGELDNKKALSSEEVSTLRAYIYSKTILIRDLAQARLASSSVGLMFPRTRSY